MHRDAADTPLHVVGVPGCRRIELLTSALDRLGLPQPHLWSYRSLIDDLAAIDLPARAHLRIESPGDDFETEKALIAFGFQGGPGDLDAHQLERMEPDPGRILAPRQWYHGLTRLVNALAQRLANRDLRWSHAPDMLSVLFDKRATQARLAANYVPVPPFLPAPPASYDMLRREALARGWRRVFVKLAYGSCASGIIAIDLGGQQPRAVTTMERVPCNGRVRYYNNRRLQHYHHEGTIAELVDYLLGEGAQVEQWLAKARGRDGNFDFRVLVLAGRARHVVMRCSRGPLTNLHLGNRRGDVNGFIERIGLTRWRGMLQFAEHAAACFPGCMQVGVDLMVSPDLERTFVLEVNAFGDLLPGVLDSGMDTYTAQMAMLFERPVDA